MNPRLVERIRRVSGGAEERGSYVLYWLHSTLRAHENPALEVARAHGRRLGLPVFVYHALSDRHPYANDRHWRFALEGARDLQAEFEQCGIGYAFHLERPSNRGPWLRQLARDAAIVVTDDVPVEPLRSWTSNLAASIDAAVECVDTSCTLPMRVVGRAFDRAFAFRRATERARADRLAESVADADDEAVQSGEAFVPELPFEPFDLRSSLAAGIATCAIDHGIAPVPDTRGGSTAGYARWNEFVSSGGLDRYARKRNDPVLASTSRLSPYLHWGMVSPFRIAREARARGGGGAEKFLDELLIWRELAWCFCAHHDDLDSFAAIPAWARETLAAHVGDERPVIFDADILARARSGDALWDACQLSLLRHGELHNNLRMTWGKAFLQWDRDPEAALRTAIDLNHRYALDGRDPSSYGGLLWCFGQFDRPFAPEIQILGAVRPRPLEQHAQRLDVDRYAARAQKSAFAFAPRVAVVGAGIAGLACARTLSDHGTQVRLFDKARGPGGRMASRRADLGTFDLGCPAFEARDPRFRRVVEAWHERGLVARWEGEYVGHPRMSAITRALAEDLDVVAPFLVRRIEKRGARYWLHAGEDESRGPFDRVVVTTPVPQARPLLEPAPKLVDDIAAAEYAPGMTWASRLVGDRLPAGEHAFGRRSFENSVISTIVREASKPGRADRELLVAHVTPDFAATMFDEDPARTLEVLHRALTELSGVRVVDIEDEVLHRWKFATVRESLGVDCLVDDTGGLLYAGDACLGSTVENAWLSGVAAAGRILGMLADGEPPSRQSELFSS